MAVLADMTNEYANRIEASADNLQNMCVRELYLASYAKKASCARR